ncbi:MAG: hypothetical protein EBZ48_04040 [Proteobacteria bacterium]|nr:hypothetical protein [Pseudomonadota bacterium]
MKSLRLALSFLLVPRLFASLILFPLLLSLLLVAGQIFVTTALLKSLSTDLTSAEHPASETKQSSFVRMVLFGDSAPRPQIQTCRWVKRYLEGERFAEVPPSKECAPDRLDVALHVRSPAAFVATQYEEILNGSFERIHICERDCTPYVVIFPEETPIRTKVYSLWTWALLYEARIATTTRKDFVDKLNEIKLAQSLIGNQFLFLEGMRGAVSLKNLMYSAVIVLNLAMLVIVALWLALKAHRRVLDYFSRSGALLPLVAATGNGTFYAALWLLTLIRVAAFLGAAAPLTIIEIAGAIPDDAGPLLGGIDLPEFLLWLIALSVSFGFATLIASIADLKHRHALFSFLYKFIPLLISGIGAAVWGFSFLIHGSTGEALRDTIASLPLVGMAPILVAPILKPKLTIFVINTLLTMILLAAAARLNARWFAAHLEEI